MLLIIKKDPKNPTKIHSFKRVRSTGRRPLKFAYLRERKEHVFLSELLKFLWKVHFFELISPVIPKITASETVV